MPRTKQIHPRNLRDKIEEAQKELNGAEVSKTEILEAGVKGASESLKGVKRKKIVAENHLKKIPKSPLRNPLQTKHKQNTEASSFPALQSTSEAHKKHSYSPVKNGKQFTKQNGETPGLIAETTKSEGSVSLKRPSFLSHPAELRRWRSEGSEPIQLGVLEEKQPWGSSPSPSRSDHSESVPHPLPRCSTSSPSYTSTAFDVLLKAMEPELSTLSQKGSTCAIRTEKLRPNKTVRSPSTVKNSSGDASGHTTQEIAAESQSSPGTYCPVPVAATQKDEPTAAQPVSQPHHPQEHFASTPNQHDQQPPGHPAFTGLLTNLQTPENANLEQIYNTAMASTIGLTSPSCRTQVVPAPTQQVEPASPASTSPAHPTPSPPRPPHSSAPVVSVVGQSGEQVCSLLLREQKPKKPGKYVCEYCSRACAKPSVLLKHIRSHTGERPYPCVTCGFSFKTKSNLYKHKKSHAHTLKLGLVLQPDAGGLFLAQESPRALSVHSDVEDSGESEEEGSADGRQNDSGAMELRPMQILKKLPNLEALPQSGSLRSNPDHVAIGFSPQNRPSESEAVTELPKVVIQSVSMSPFKTDSSKPEPASMQGQKDLQLANTLSETEEKSLQKGDLGLPGGGQEPRGGPAHAQLQRQQATDDSQEQQGKLLSPRSLGSTDSGYFSRSESADQAVSPPTPFARNFPTMDLDSVKNSAPPAPRVSTPAPTPLCVGEKPSVSPGQMRPPLATKTLEERISKLISDNEALVDDKQLDSVKPRRTSLSRRGSIDSPKSYIFKDSFQFDLKPMGRRTSSSSDIPKSPFTPTEKSKQVFLLSVPSLDCLPITRSNSMPTTGCSAVPPSVIPPPHPLRGSQSFDDKIGTFYDDVFVSGPNPSVPHSGHPRPLVRQAAVEDPSASEHHVGVGPSLDEGCQGCPGGGELGPGRSKPATQPSHLEKKKSHQGRGTMFECETCRNRYRKLENFENHKKFYCSELHGPKTKVAVREPEPSPVPSGTQPQVLHYRVAAPPGVWEQTPQIRKRRKMKSVGDDEDPQPRESRALKSAHAPQLQPAPGSAPSPSTPSATLTSEQPPGGLQVRSSPAQARLVARGSEQVEQQLSRAAQDQLEGKRQGTGISVIQHTNSLSRPSSLDKSEPCEGGSVASFQELRRAGKPEALKVIGVAPEEGHPLRDVLQPRQSTLSDALKGELQESSRTSPGDRHGSGLPSRLVRQHHIQVPEILVTEEPDGGQEAQGPEEEKAETFSWPQRSETLSKLPTEKLPPKKKRLRLAEMEHSSTESSFDSTLSRSPSRESSLSHTSSFSASLDIEDISKTEASPKIDFPPRAEFLLIPPGSNTLSIPGSHREMRRAASEQITCVPTLMEVSEFRSKSFDCGSMTPPRAAALPESQPFTAPSAVGLTGHVPLLERRRGPLIRQISLNIAPDSHLPPLHASPFQSITLPSVKTGPQGLQPPNTPPAGFPAHTLQSWTRTTDLPMERSSTGSADSFPPQQSFGTSLLNQTHVPLSHQSLQPPLVASALGVRADARSAVCVSSTGAVEDCFPPKYQLHCQLPPSSQACSANPLRPLPNQVLADPAAADHSPASVVLPAEAGEPVASSSTLAALQPGLPGNQVRKEPVSFLLPIHLQTKSPTYCFATSLPQILVTQDLSNMPVCQTNQSPVPISEEQTPITALPKDPPNALPTPENDLSCKNILSDMGKNSPVSESLPGIQKTSVGRLSPQQESSASSKRMLSPANSLDIAMEKHQKRAKDEHGAVCAPNMRPSEPPTSRASDGQKQKKPVLVRQLCTTEPLEGGNSEQEDFSQPETSNKTVNLTDVLPADNLSSGPSRFVVTEPISELQEFENSPPKSLTVTVGNPHVPLENAHVSPVKSVGSTQERKSPGIKNQGDKTNVKGQSPPPPSGLSLSSTSDPQQLSFPSLKTATSFTWCYLLRQKSLPLPQNDQKTSAYTEWTVSPTNPNPLDLPTKVALSLLNSKQKTGKSLYCEAVTTHSKSDLLVYSSKWKNTLSKRALGNQKSTVVEFSNKDASEINSEQDKENSLIKSEPRRIKIFDGGYKSNEEYVYVRGRGRGKYICEECGIRCKKPSMLKKHIRTHTDVRPYHCTYCNFSFKTKGNLTKHMKSKAHSKKCVDLGVSVGLIDEQDTEESDEKQRFGIERSGYDLEESDGPDEDDNDNEDDDEDSQADSGLSAAPSVTASPQHLPSSSGLEDLGCTEEDLKIPEYFSGAHTDPMDILPRALLTKMTVLSTVQSDPHKRTNPPSKARQHAAQGEDETVPSVDASRPLETAPRSPCRQMSVDHPESEVLGSSVAGQAVALTQDTSCVRLPSVGAQHSPQPAPGIQSATSPHLDSQERKPQTPSHPPPGLPSSQTHLFSHLPLHSQQQSRTPYNMVPVGGIHVVPAGLTYSTFVPIQAGPVQLTIPAVSVFHRTMGTPGDTITDVSGTANPAGVAELSSVVPCIPIGQIRVPGLPNLSPPGLQSLTSLGMETVNIVGLASANLGPQVHPPGLALNAVGLQVLTGPPAQSSPGLQILNIALPTLIPSVSQVRVGTPGVPETAAARGKVEIQPQPQQSQAGNPESPHCTPDGQQENATGSAGERPRLEGPSTVDATQAACIGQGMSAPEGTTTTVQAQAQPTHSPEAPWKATPCGPQTVPADRPPRGPLRQPTAHFSDVSSDDDEDRLVIAT